MSQLMNREFILDDIRSDYFWEDTLPDFLKSSNEDQKIINLFKKEIIPLFNEGKKDNQLKWLEIGCGDFYKSFHILNSFIENINLSHINLDVIEPSPIWIKSFYKKYSPLITNKVKVDFIKSKLEDYIKSTKNYDFDFISIIHVLYEKDVTDSFLSLLDSMVENKKNCTIFISVESENSDFALIRNELSQVGFKIPETRHTILDLEFNKRQLSYISKETVGKECTIDYDALNNNNDYWLYPFLLGISKCTFKSWNRFKKKSAIEIIRNKIILLKREKLSINDKTFLIRTHE